MGSRMVAECGSCGSSDLESVIELRPTPPTCAMRKVGDPSEQERYPLELLRCARCTLVQLSCIVDPSEVFPPDYPYSSGNSRALHKNFEGLAREAKLHLDPFDLVVDVGANDGTLLSKFKNQRRIGVEPTRQADKIQGIAYRSFFSESLARQIRDAYGPAKVITACNVLAHVADPHDFLEGVRVLLADDGVFITENGDLSAIFDGGWDFIYHEHLRYYDARSLHGLLTQHGLVPQEHEDLQVHGGSFRTICIPGVAEPTKHERDEAWRRDFRRLREDIKRNRWYVRSLVSSMGALGERVAAIGATARATTLIAAYEFDVADIEAVYEVSTSDKLGHYIPGTQIPVVDEQALSGPDAPENALLLLWYMQDALVPKLRDIGYRGDIVVPLPKLKTLTQPKATV